MRPAARGGYMGTIDALLAAGANVNARSPFGDTAITYSSTDSVVRTGHDTLHLDAGFGRPGTYTVRVKRKFYRDAVVPNVTVVAGVCGGPVATVVPVSLQLAPGAPALRSLMVFGATFLYAPGAQSQLFGRFDADPSVPTTVTWRLSDTTAARIDSFGVVTAKCTAAKGVVDTVTDVHGAYSTTLMLKTLPNRSVDWSLEEGHDPR